MKTTKTKAAKPVPTVSSHASMFTRLDIKERLGSLAVEHIENDISVPSLTTLKFSKGYIRKGTQIVYRVLIKGHGNHTPVYTPYKANEGSYFPVGLTYADLKYLLVTLTAAEKFVAEFRDTHKAAFEKAVGVVTTKLNELKVGDVETIAKYRGQIDVLTQNYNKYVSETVWSGAYPNKEGTQLEIDAQKALNALETI